MCKKILALAIASTLPLLGCETLQKNASLLGGVGGTALGGLAANKLVSKKWNDKIQKETGVSGKTISTGAGALIGGLIGYGLGSYLEPEDETNLSQTTQQTLETGKPNSFVNNRTGVMGETKVIQTSAVNNQECKTIQQTISLQDGSTKTEDIKACKGPNGWQTVKA